MLLPINVVVAVVAHGVQPASDVLGADVFETPASASSCRDGNGYSIEEPKAVI
ncbi:hypothetical protein [Bradyrhizobium sacchari]|uniref:hypothetical protein n=1 Tax=Bradyrhizobium sacchari TaxID=1399419 RepID=UPI0013747B2F|nr:hypothetical protein [Bradyrhizobium sacchari]